MELTEKEFKVMTVIKESDFGVGSQATVQEIFDNGNCTCATVKEMVEGTGLSKHQVAGTLGSLMEKGFVAEWDFNWELNQQEYGASEAGLKAWESQNE